MNNPLDTLTEFESKQAGAKGFIYSLPALKKSGLDVSRMPVCARIVLESVLRNCDGKLASEEDVRRLASWNAQNPGDYEVPFVVSRIVLQDFTGVPLLVDLAAMRDAAAKLGADPSCVEPLVPVDLVVDHSVQMDFAGTPDAYEKNLDMEFDRNRERYEFLKWGQSAFKTFSVVPPSTGIIHQINLEFLARLVFKSESGGKTVFYPDTLVGTDSHTTMINGLGVVGWGVGGIEAEAGMLGQPVYFKVPEVVGVRMAGRLEEGVTSTDLALHVTQMLRREKVVGKFVEFFGEGRAEPFARRPRDSREHGARIRGDNGLLPSRRNDARIPAADGARRKARRPRARLLQSAGYFRNPLRRRVRLHESRRPRPPRKSARPSPAPSARRTKSTSRNPRRPSGISCPKSAPTPTPKPKPPRANCATAAS